MGCLLLSHLLALQLLAADEPALNRQLRQQCAFGSAAKVAELLKQGADPNAVDENGGSALGAALENRDPKVLQLLLAAGAKPDPSAMRTAGRVNRPESLNLLLEAGGDPHAALAGAAMGHHFRLVRRLLANGASPKSKEAALALHGAMRTRAGGWEMVQMLLEAGADPNAMNNTGQTPLHTAASPGVDLCIVKALLDAGAKLDTPNDEGLTPVRLAAIYGNKSTYAFLLKANGGKEPRPAADPASSVREKSTGDLLDMLRPNSQGPRREAVRELASRGKEIMPELLNRLETRDGIQHHHRLLVAMGPDAEAAWPKLEELLDAEQHVFNVLAALNTMRDTKRGDLAELPLAIREKAAAAFYKKAIESNVNLAEAAIGPLVNLGEVSAPHLLKLLRSDDPRQRRSVAHYLQFARFPNAEIQTELIKLTGEGVAHDIRVNAIQALSRFGEADKELQTTLLNIMKKPPGLSKEDGKPFEQWQQAAHKAARSLARFGPDVIDPLVPLLSAGDGPERGLAIMVLQEVGPSAIPKLMELLVHDDKAVAMAAQGVLDRVQEGIRGRITALRSEQDGSITYLANWLEYDAEIGVESIRNIVKEALPDLFAIASSDEHALVVRAAAAHAALKIDLAQSRESKAILSAIPALIRVLDQGTFQEQLHAAEALGQIGAPAREALPLLRERLKLPGEEIDLGALSRDALQRQAQAAIAAIEKEADGARRDK